MPRKPRWTGSTSADRLTETDLQTAMSCAPTRTSNRRTSVRIDQGPRSADPSDPSSPPGPCPCARTDLHARLLPHLASESRVETVAVHRRTPTRHPDPVAKAVRSSSAQQKAQTKRTSTGTPRTATARCSPSSPPRPGTPPACTATPAPSRSSPSHRAPSRSARPRRHAPIVADR